MASFTKKVKITDRKNVSVTSWKGKVWLHIRDEVKGKNVSFSKDEFVNFLNRLDKIQNYIKECDRHIKKSEKSKPKRDTTDFEMSSNTSDSE